MQWLPSIHAPPDVDEPAKREEEHRQRAPAIHQISTPRCKYEHARGGHWWSERRFVFFPTERNDPNKRSENPNRQVSWQMFG